MDQLTEHELGKQLGIAFGQRLRGVWLFGSEARGDATADSDIDLLVLLDGPVRQWQDLGCGIEATYEVSMKLGRPIHPLPVAWGEFDRSDFSLYRTVRKEGRPL
jgi:predicted nucleotidyltransferase